MTNNLAYFFRSISDEEREFLFKRFNLQFFEWKSSDPIGETEVFKTGGK
jgi:hypothetical protein